MAKPTRQTRSQRIVWRISELSPYGEYVDPDAPVERVRATPKEVREPGWLLSSFDLAMGLEVTDSTNALAPEDFDALFGRAR